MASRILFGAPRFWQWLFERASLHVNTSLRQFEAAELSHTRLICYRNRSFWGLGGETLACQAVEQLF